MSEQAENRTAGEIGGAVPHFSVGTALREGRELLGLSVADVANRIKFAPRQIEAMEADDFGQLPEMAFVRGFVRSYARLLEIDATPLLAALPQKHLPLSSATESKPVEVSPPPLMFASRRLNFAWLGAGLLVALIVMIVFSRMHDMSSGPLEPAVQTNVETLELPATLLSAASAPTVSAATGNAEVIASKPPAPASVATPPAKKAQSEQVKPATAQMLSSKGTVAEKEAKDKAAKDQQDQAAKKSAAKEPLKKEPAPTQQRVDTTSVNAAPGIATMRLVFDEDSWAEVKDANGKILLSKMNHAGSLVRLSGASPLSVVIGHASGVHLFHDGKEIDLGPYTSVEVARLLLESR